MNNISPTVANELNQIITLLPKEEYSKIPQTIIDKINKKQDNSYITNINKIDDINQDKIMDETKQYLSYIFLNYLANEEEKEEYNIILKENEERYQNELKKKYDIEKVFEQRRKITTDNNLVIIQPEKTLIARILEKIKKIFQRKEKY